ncbi:MAG: biopolymer transporter ExbD [Bacteroidales bacterium]|nr:biopolymer transporter ExbD [Bacteroidales bacterium]
MTKVKLPRKSTAIDMTAMCDVAFLLLTFFMLTSNFTQKEPVMVNTPSSISEIKIPERNIMTILIDKSGKLFFGIDGQEKRIDLLKKMGEAYSFSFTDAELKEFSLINRFGVPIQQMKAFLALKPADQDLQENALGIPYDSLDNQFKNWVRFSRIVNPQLRIAIKADQALAYPVIKNVMNTLQDLDENRYNLITSLEQTPE